MTKKNSDSIYEYISLVGTDISKSSSLESTPDSEIEEFKARHKEEVSDKYTRKQLEMSITEDEELIANFKKDIELHESLIRLSENEDFKNLIESYFSLEKDRITEVLVQPHALDNNTVNQLNEKLNGIRHFKLFLKASASRADEAADEVEMKSLNISIIKEIIEEESFKVEDK